MPGNLPLDVRRPGTFNYFDDTSGARGQLAALDRSMAIIAMGDGVASFDTPIQVGNEAEADLAAGTGSELALLARAAFRTFRKAAGAPVRGSAPPLWLVPVEAPSGGTKRTVTVTFTGPASAGGEEIVRIAGREIRVLVADEDSATTIAAAFKAVCDRRAYELPVTCAVAAGVATLSYRHKSVNGDDLVVEAVGQPVAGTTVVVANGVSGAGVADYEDGLAALLAREYGAIALANHAAADVVDVGAHLDEAWAPDVKKYRHVFLGETGTLSTATGLADDTDANRKELVIVSFEGGWGLPGEYATAVAAMVQTKSKPNCNWDNIELPVPPCADADNYISSELEAAILGGVTALQLTPTGGVKIVRLVTTKATENSLPFEPLRDLAVSKTQAYYAKQIDIAMARIMSDPERGADADLDKDLRSAAIEILLKGQEVRDLHNVEAHLAEVQVYSHPEAPTRKVAEIPESVVPNCHQLDSTFRLFVEAPLAAAAA